jgi:hypothetical protein
MRLARAPGAVGKIAQVAAITELMIKHKEHAITPETLAEFRERVLGHRPRQRSNAEKMDPPPAGEVGPNGGRIGYLPNGDKVEWIKDEDDDGRPLEWPMLLLRNDTHILAAYRIKVGQDILSESQAALFKRAAAPARRIEKKYGRESLGWDDFEWRLLNGRMSALSWVMGSEWNESLDT